MDENYTDAALIYIMLADNGAGYDYYDDGLMYGGEDAWGGLDDGGAGLGFEMGDMAGDGSGGGWGDGSAGGVSVGSVGGGDFGGFD